MGDSLNNNIDISFYFFLVFNFVNSAKNFIYQTVFVEPQNYQKVIITFVNSGASIFFRHIFQDEISPGETSEKNNFFHSINFRQLIGDFSDFFFLSFWNFGNIFFHNFFCIFSLFFLHFKFIIFSINKNQNFMCKINFLYFFRENYPHSFRSA